jgi:hypothetical protein
MTLMKRISLLAASVAVHALTTATPASAFDSTRIGECYFKQSPNSTPIASLDNCEIVSSTGQGFYYFGIKFNAKRQYVVKGGDSARAWEDAPATINGKHAKFFSQDGYSCWKKSNPYHEICIK